ncbi:uncharacterized protein LOC113216235 isoform X2 [Frankliniella occidentalis]|uniref:Uncharacterized protein LOC113216235 isoform X2 n=1 Tax=Frankliniella occidentalis TaxID=133901 RepID=A0A6J1TEQ8_FRAOC|nr:uncharacterized protein LOC113216235 isoform X2 [Frankliniella occidentalis]
MMPSASGGGNNGGDQTRTLAVGRSAVSCRQSSHSAGMEMAATTPLPGLRNVRLVQLQLGAARPDGGRTAHLHLQSPMKLPGHVEPEALQMFLDENKDVFNEKTAYVTGRDGADDAAGEYAHLFTSCDVVVHLHMDGGDLLEGVLLFNETRACANPLEHAVGAAARPGARLSRWLRRRCRRLRRLFAGPGQLQQPAPAAPAPAAPAPAAPAPAAPAPAAPAPA